MSDRLFAGPWSQVYFVNMRWDSVLKDEVELLKITGGGNHRENKCHQLFSICMGVFSPNRSRDLHSRRVAKRCRWWSYFNGKKQISILWEVCVCDVAFLVSGCCLRRRKRCVAHTVHVVKLLGGGRRLVATWWRKVVYKKKRLIWCEMSLSCIKRKET